jgi:hypothetical protein
VHGYSLLRTQLNKAYFEELFDASTQFGIGIEGHRASFRDDMLSAYDFMM